MDELDEALTGFLGATKDKLGAEKQVNELGRKVLVLARGRTAEQLNPVLESLVRGLDAPHPQVAGFVALIGGCLVEEGGNPEALLPRLLSRVTDALLASRRIVDAVSKMGDTADGGGQAGQGVWVGEQLVAEDEWDSLLQADPSGVQSFLALDQFCQPLIAALSRVPDMLGSEEAERVFAAVEPVASVSEFASFLDRLLRVPTGEKWVILDPRTNRGFELFVSGVANAFQVYVLVHDALLKARRTLWNWTKPVPGPPPSDQVLSVARGEGPQSDEGVYVPPFTLFRWSAVTAQRRVPNMEDYKEWYSNSAIPAELAWYGDARVGVLGDFGIKMELALTREFAVLPARVDLRGELERRHVIELLNAFTEAKHPGHPVPCVGWRGPPSAA